MYYSTGEPSSPASSACPSAPSFELSSELSSEVPSDRLLSLWLEPEESLLSSRFSVCAGGRITASASTRTASAGTATCIASAGASTRTASAGAATCTASAS